MTAQSQFFQHTLSLFQQSGDDDLIQLLWCLFAKSEFLLRGNNTSRVMVAILKGGICHQIVVIATHFFTRKKNFFCLSFRNRAVTPTKLATPTEILLEAF